MKINIIRKLRESLTLFFLIFLILISFGCKQKVKRQNSPSEFELSLKANIAELNSYAKMHSKFSAREVDLSKSNFIRYELLPEKLKNKLDVKFYGDVKKLLASLSNYCGFIFNVKGVPSSSNNYVYINKKNEMLVDLLSSIGAQTSNDISVAVAVDVAKENFVVDLIYPKK